MKINIVMKKCLILAICSILLFSACAYAPIQSDKLPGAYTVGIVCTSGSKNKSSIIYFDDNLDQTGVTYYPYAGMGELFYAPVIFEDTVSIIPQGQANKKNEKVILQQNLETFEQKTYSLDQIAIYGLSVDSSAIFAANNMNGRSFVSRIDKVNGAVKTVTYDDIYISIVYSYGGKLYAFSSQSTETETRGTLHCLDSVTLEELKRIDLTSLGNAVYSVTAVDDILYFTPVETSQGTSNHIVGTYNTNTDEVGAIEFSDVAYHVLSVGDELYITHGNLVTGEGTALSVYDIAAQEIKTYDLSVWPGQITIHEDALYVMSTDRITKFDLHTMNKQSEVKIPLGEGCYLSGIFSHRFMSPDK